MYEPHYATMMHSIVSRVVQRLKSRPIISPGYPRNATARPGDDVQFECPLFSDLVPIVVWLMRKCDESGRNCGDAVEAKNQDVRFVRLNKFMFFKQFYRVLW